MHQSLPLLIRRPHQNLVDVDVRRLCYAVQHRIGDILWLQLPYGCGPGIERLLRAGIRNVVAQLGFHDTRLDDRYADVVLVDLAPQRLG